jgi:hypothetical protein
MSLLSLVNALNPGSDMDDGQSLSAGEGFTLDIHAILVWLFVAEFRMCTRPKFEVPLSTAPVHMLIASNQQ